MKRLIVIATAMFASMAALAVPANPNPIEIEQPNGSKITIILKGDERVKWAETEDGYSLLRGKDGFWEYAAKAENGDMIASGIRVMSGLTKSATTVGIPKYLRFSKAQVEAALADENSPEVTAGIDLAAMYKSTNGEAINYKIPVILVSFSDKSYTYSNADFDEMFNAPNLTKDKYTGSVIDYFYENSRGKFIFNADVYGPYTVSENMAYYGGNSNITGKDRNPGTMVREAIALADKDGCDFSQYDYNNDGLVDGVHIIFAGLGEEMSEDANAIWSHKSQLAPVEVYDGKQVYVYSCSPEQRNSNGRMSGIGTLIHEIGHTLGLPDFYDTDYRSSGGESITPGVYDIMDLGSHSDEGFTPPQYNAWSKMFLGWNKKYILDTASTVNINPALEETRTYVIETKRENEYFVLDNRPASKWDKWAGVGVGGGLLIFVVDSNYGMWLPGNRLNVNPLKRSFYIKQANCGDSSTCTMGRSTPFPGLFNKTYFTDTSSPSSLARDGSKTEKPITNIIIDSKKHVIFDLIGGGDTVCGAGEIPTPLVSVEPILQDSENNVIIYPNPAKEKITVASKVKVKELVLYNMTGKQIAKSNKNEINVNTLPAGIYVLEIKTAATKTSHKVIITR
jgi:M6 family metalloprotease-like protein